MPDDPGERARCPAPCCRARRRPHRHHRRLYGPFVSEGPHPRGILHPTATCVATKAGFTRRGRTSGRCGPPGVPEAVPPRCRCAASTSRPPRPLAAAPHSRSGRLASAPRPWRGAGPPRRRGCRSTTLPSRAIVPITTVQGLWPTSPTGRQAVLESTGRIGIGFIPWFPVASGGPPAPAARSVPSRSATPAVSARLAAAPLAGDAARSPAPSRWPTSR